MSLLVVGGSETINASGFGIGMPTLKTVSRTLWQIEHQLNLFSCQRKIAYPYNGMLHLSSKLQDQNFIPFYPLKIYPSIERK